MLRFFLYFVVTMLVSSVILTETAVIVGYGSGGTILTYIVWYSSRIGDRVFRDFERGTEWRNRRDIVPRNCALSLSPDETGILSVVHGENYVALQTVNVFNGETRVVFRAEENSGIRLGLSHFDWSPDASQIAYVQWNQASDSADVFVLDVNDGEVRNISDHPRDDVQPNWSPDGSQIAFLSDRGVERPNYRLWVVNPDGSNLRLLTPEEEPIATFIWSLDGRYIVFSTLEGEIYPLSSSIYIVNVETGDVQLLVDDLPNAFATAWLPDNRHIVINVNAEPATEIYVIDLERNELRRMVADTSQIKLGGGSYVPEVDRIYDGVVVDTQNGIALMIPQQIYDDFVNSDPRCN